MLRLGKKTLQEAFYDLFPPLGKGFSGETP